MLFKHLISRDFKQFEKRSTKFKEFQDLITIVDLKKLKNFNWRNFYFSNIKYSSHDHLILNTLIV